MSSLCRIAENRLRPFTLYFFASLQNNSSYFTLCSSIFSVVCRLQSSIGSCESSQILTISSWGARVRFTRCLRRHIVKIQCVTIQLYYKIIVQFDKLILLPTLTYFSLFYFIFKLLMYQICRKGLRILRFLLLRCIFLYLWTFQHLQITAYIWMNGKTHKHVPIISKTLSFKYDNFTLRFFPLSTFVAQPHKTVTQSNVMFVCEIKVLQ